MTSIIGCIENGRPLEGFIGLTLIKSYESELLNSDILESLKALTLDIYLCRGQSHDNASNMSGKYAGVQASIKEINGCEPIFPVPATH